MDINTITNRRIPLIMGILNLTPNSFSDGGKFNTVDKALKQALKLEEDGADFIDVGGESTGPKSEYVSLEEELNRVIPVLKALRKKTKLPISIDTYKSEVAKQAFEYGANIINDVTALRGDKSMARLAAKLNCPIILMHSKDSTARTTVQKKKYKNVIKTIDSFFRKRIRYAEKQGIKRKNIIIDPGMGQFISAIPKYSFEIIARLQELKKFKLPILVGISRKSCIGGPMETREEKGKVLEAIAFLNGANIIRTHNVKNTKEFIENLMN